MKKQTIFLYVLGFILIVSCILFLKYFNLQKNGDELSKTAITTVQEKTNQPISSKEKPFSKTQSSQYAHFDSKSVNGKYLGGRVSIETSYGSGPDQVGKGERHDFEMGPASFFVASNGMTLILDQFNHRVMKKIGKSLAPLFTYQTEGKTNFSDIFLTQKGDMLLLDGYDAHEIVKFSKAGERLGTIKVKLESDDEPRHIVATKDGTFFLEGMFGVYKLSNEGVSKKVPGMPFYNDSKKFVQTKKVEAGIFDTNIIASDGKVINTFRVEAPYGSLPDVFTDAKDYVYLGFGYVLSEPPSDSRLKDKVPSSLYVVQIYSKDGKLVNAINLERKEFVDYERGVSITKEGKLYRFVSSPSDVKILEHDLPKAAKFSDPNSEG